MKSFAIFVLPLVLMACSESESEAEDIPVNQMAPDEVTEVQDESAVDDAENSERTNETDDD